MVEPRRNGVDDHALRQFERTGSVDLLSVAGGRVVRELVEGMEELLIFVAQRVVLVVDAPVVGT